MPWNNQDDNGREAGGPQQEPDLEELLKADPPTQVIDAFRDVQAAATDKETLQNQAFAYAGRIIPKARGEAEAILQRAKGYRQQTVAEATGQAAAL